MFLLAKLFSVTTHIKSLTTNREFHLLNLDFTESNSYAKFRCLMSQFIMSKYHLGDVCLLQHFIYCKFAQDKNLKLMVKKLLFMLIALVSLKVSAVAQDATEFVSLTFDLDDAARVEVSINGEVLEDLQSGINKVEISPWSNMEMEDETKSFTFVPSLKLLIGGIGGLVCGYLSG